MTAVVLGLSSSCRLLLFAYDSAAIFLGRAFPFRANRGGQACYLHVVEACFFDCVVVVVSNAVRQLTSRAYGDAAFDGEGRAFVVRFCGLNRGPFVSLFDRFRMQEAGVSLAWHFRRDVCGRNEAEKFRVVPLVPTSIGRLVPCPYY